MEKYFLHQIKHNKNTDAWDKGIVVKDTLTEVEQSYHAYLGAYGYNSPTGQDYDYVACYVTNAAGNREMWRVWEAPSAVTESEVTE